MLDVDSPWRELGPPGAAPGPSSGGGNVLSVAASPFANAASGLLQLQPLQLEEQAGPLAHDDEQVGDRKTEKAIMLSEPQLYLSRWSSSVRVAIVMAGRHSYSFNPGDKGCA